VHSGHNGHCFERDPPLGPEDWAPSASDTAALGVLVNELAAERQGEPYVFDVISAVREWLEANTVRLKPPKSVVVPASGGGDGADDDLDEADMDEEMIEALREVLRGGGVLLRLLDEAEGCKSGSKEQRSLLHKVWQQLSPAQKIAMVASDSDSSDEAEEVVHSKVASKPKKGKDKQSNGGVPSSAQRQCPKGHALSSYNNRPNDYARFTEGIGFSCDVCGGDFKYVWGIHHCDKCKDWDCCVSCGSEAKGKKTKKGSSKRMKR